MSAHDSRFLFSGGTVYTLNPQQPVADALVVEGKSIVYVGNLSGAREFVTEDTREIDLAGGMLLPGFIDAHDHLIMGAATKVGVDLSGITGTAQVCAAITEWVDAAPEGTLLRGHGWMPASFEEGTPRRQWLDEITGDRPMALLSADAHDIWFNTAAMNVCGLTKDSPDPVPGAQYFVRDEDGWPTGHGVEGATCLLIGSRLGFFSPEGITEAMKLTVDPAPSWGITATYDAGILIGEKQDESEPIFQMLVERDKAGNLPIRIVGSVWTRNADDVPQHVTDTLVQWNKKYASEHVSVSVNKLWADGTMMSYGSLLLEPFCTGSHGRGTMSFTPEHIEAQIEATQRAGFDMHIHNDGDGSVRVILDAIERVQQRIGRGDSRHTVCHNTLVHPDDIPRFAELGVIANVTPMWGTNYNGVYIDVYEELLGPGRVELESFPYGDLVRSGAVVTYGADIPGVLISEIAPLIQIEAAVTRQRPGFPHDRVFIERQRVNLEQALAAVTINAAYQIRMEDQIGSLEVGKRADLVVLGRNLFEIDPHEIHSTPILLTMMDGKITFEQNVNA